MAQRLTETAARRWQAGDQIALREVYRGRIWVARAATVVQDSDDLVAAYLAPGTRWKVPADTPRTDVLRRLQRGWRLGDYQWTGPRMLYLLRRGVSHAIHLWWLPPDWRFGGWYVNLQEPIRRTALGFDYMDQMLDIVIDPDLSWRWKDEDEIDEALAIGLLTPEQASAIRGEGERVIRTIEARAAPFDAGWEEWQPDPAWPAPRLPDGWDTIGLT